MSHATVSPEFPPGKRAAIACVAEAPGDVEMLERMPLVGPTGRTYNMLLRTAGIDRDTILTTNVFNTQIPEEGLAEWCGGAKDAAEWEEYSVPPIKEGSSRRYLRPEHVWQLDRLEEELLAARPNVIVAMGSLALWALTGECDITRRRGAVHQVTMFRSLYGTKIIPTFHPSFLFHNWKHFDTTAMDLAKARRESAYPEIRVTPRRLVLKPTLAEFREYKEDLLDGAAEIAIDIETIPSYRQITCVGFAPNANTAICVPFVDRQAVSRSYWETPEEEVEAWRLVREICMGPAVKIGQNFTYNAYWLWEVMRIPTMKYREDTRLLHHALLPELPKDLGYLGSRYANAPSWKTMRRKGEKRDE